jgi:NAD-dependent dihydropyrimidine dehydrogenase PreA subunit
MDEPAKIACTHYYVTVNKDGCTGCGNCEDICQMGAITVRDGSAGVNLARCIGCGLCVTRCEFHAIRVVEKEESKKYTIPANTVEQYMKIAWERGL